MRTIHLNQTSRGFTFETLTSSHNLLVQHELSTRLILSEIKMLFGGEEMQVDIKHSASQTIKVKTPVCITSNFSLKNYVKNETDLRALTNRKGSIYLHVQIYEVAPQQSQLPHLIRLKRKLNGAALLGKFYNQFYRASL